MKRAPWCQALAVALLVASGAGWAADADAGTPPQPQTFERKAEPTRVRLGEPFTYEVVLTHASDQRYEWRPSELGAFELVDQKRQRSDGAGSATTRLTFTLMLFELGKQTIPDFAFEVTSPAGITEWRLPGVEVEGVGVLPEDAEEKGAELKDLKPLAEVPVRTYRLLYWALGLLALLALAWGVYRYLKRSRPLPVPVAAPKVPLHQRTRNALDALAAEDLPGQGQTRDFYFRLSDIVRGYLGERYGFEALECTRPELLEALRTRNTPGLPMEELVRFLDEADLVKFAKAPVGLLECKRDLELGYRLVEVTPFPPPPSAPVGGAA